MRRSLVAVLLLLCAAPPASATGPRAADFELPVAAAGKARAAHATWTSRVLRPGRRFDVFGVRWARASAHLHLRARVHDPRHGWRRWVELGHAHSAKGSDPVWAGGADAVQLRVEGRPRGLRAHFVAVSAPPRRIRARAAQAQFGDAPAIVPRSEWEGNQCRPRDAPRYGEVHMAFVHHTVTANEYGPEDSREMVLGICRFHRNSNGWDDVGYNFLVDKYGQIFEGRAVWIDQAIVGAQAQGYNSVSTGIANLGNYQDVPQTDAALDAMARLLAWKLPLHGAPVEGQVTVVSAGGSSNKFASGHAVTFERISGHRDGNSTACPGGQLYAQLPRLRELAAGRAPALGPPPPAGGIPVALSLQPAAPAFPFPQPVRVTGRMTDGAGAGVAGRKVKIEIGTTQGWRSVTSTSTAPDGSWAAEFPATRSWDVRAIHNEVASPRTRVVVTPVLSARPAASRVTAGRSAVLVGSVRPQKAAVRVEVWRQAGPNSSRFVRAATLHSRARAGRFRAAIRLRRPGLYRLRALFPGDRRNGPAQAADVFVRAIRGAGGGTVARSR
ncbi:MAG TPA: peptidoglycan recognition protein [Solirubrobacteraceae bacterium]|nr:peptidoglycan recognition protein [Solirubrobacteraceae bacterium]